MRAFVLGLAVVLAVVPSTALLAQETSDPSSSGSNGTPEPREARNDPQPSSFDVDGLGVSVERIKREVRQAPTVAETFDGQRLRTYIRVYGVAPPIRLFSEGERPTTPAPYGGMTHNEFLNLVTPQQFRRPAANLSNVAFAITDWAKKKARERKEREERERREREQW
ncbi:MAG: hypothetical protein GEU99_21340 [Luteitalea sp.]|nr:hypothetical protein [Luteitalea sp.]